MQTYLVQFALGNNQENLTINTNKLTFNSKEQIINQEIQFHLKRNIPKATESYKICID